MKLLTLATALLASIVCVTATPPKKIMHVETCKTKDKTKDEAEPRYLIRNIGFEDSDCGEPQFVDRGKSVRISSDPDLARTGNNSLIFEVNSRQDVPSITFERLEGVEFESDWTFTGHYRVIKGKNVTDESPNSCILGVGFVGNIAAWWVDPEKPVSMNEYRVFNLNVSVMKKQFGSKEFVIKLACQEEAVRGSSVVIAIDDISLREGRSRDAPWFSLYLGPK
ncbi:hypothetical protein ACHAPU_003127 [Fusarium lateritium]